MHYYRPRRVPMKIPLTLALIFVRIGYNAACAWEYKITPLSHTTNSGYIYCLGYLPIFLIMATMVWSGWKDMNEDLWIIKQRREREFQLNSELRAHKESVKGKLPPVPTGGLPPARNRNDNVAV